MVTTIQVQETTKQLLERVKIDEHLSTYDDAIRRLLVDKMRVPDMFGVTKKKPLRFSKKDELGLHEL